MSLESSLYVYKSTVDKVSDADTAWLILDRGFGDKSKKKIRLSRIDAWETRGEEKSKGLEAKSFVEGLMPVGSEIIIQSKGKDKYGRVISEVWVKIEKDLVNLSDLLVDKGHAEYKDYPEASFVSW